VPTRMVDAAANIAIAEPPAIPPGSPLANGS